MINAKSAEDVAIDQSFARHVGEKHPAAAISANRSPDELALDQSFADMKLSDKPARVLKSLEDAAIEQSFGVACVTPTEPTAAAKPTVASTEDDLPALSAPKPVAEKVAQRSNSVEPPLSQEAVETARTVLAAGGTVNDARLSLLRRASSDTAFRTSLAPSLSKRRNESYIGLEHRDAVFRAVDAAGATL